MAWSLLQLDEMYESIASEKLGVDISSAGFIAVLD